MDSYCRTCMSQFSGNTENISESHNIFQVEDFLQKLILCSNLKIEPNDGYPTSVCENCFENVIRFDNFQKMCHDSFDMFTKVLLELNNLKEEETEGGIATIEAKDNLEDNEDIKLDFQIESTDFPIDPLLDCTDTSSNELEEEAATSMDTVKNKTVNSDDDMLTKSSEVKWTIIDKSKQTKRLTSRSAAKSKDMVRYIKVDCNDDSPTRSSEAEWTIIDISKQTKGLMSRSNKTVKDKNNENNFKSVITAKSAEKSMNTVENITVDCNVNMPTKSSEVEWTIIDKSEQKKKLTSRSQNTAKEANNEHNFKCVKTTKSPKSINIEKNKLVDCVDDILTKSSQVEWTIIDKTKQTKSLKSRSNNTAKEETKVHKSATTIESEKSMDTEENMTVDCDDGAVAQSSEFEWTIIDNTKEKKGLPYRLLIQCDICFKKFRFQHRLDAHIRMHQGERGYPCTRENCNRTFNRLSYLHQHLNDHDGIARTVYKCEFTSCKQTYTCRSGLRAHRRKYHSGKPPKTDIHMCETCGMVLASARSLRDHRFRHIDKAEWPFVCDVEGCAKRFRILQQLKIHQKRHAGIKNYACPHCDMRFVTRTNMNNHINTHTWEKTWSCEFCPKVSNSPAALRIHIQNKHGTQAGVKPQNQIKKIQRFKCSFCEREFVSAYGKTYHERIHTGDKPHVCEECGKSFKQPTGLTLHMRNHKKLKHHIVKNAEERPYKCDECGITYRWPNNLARHRKMH